MSNDHLYVEREFAGYRIQPVYQRLDPALSARITELWKQYNMLPSKASLERRLNQVVCLAWKPNGSLASVNTAYPGRFRGQRYFHYRLFVRPFVAEPELKVVMTITAYEFLEALELDNKPRGMLALMENPKLERVGIRAALRKGGAHYVGRDHQRRDVWLRDFAS